MRLLLLGANGQLGRSLLLRGELAKLGELTAASRDGQLVDSPAANDFDSASVDLGDIEGIGARLDALQPDIIINAAAYTAVDRAEQETALAYRINGEALGQLGAWASKRDALVVHYSTDYVFDGKQPTPYSEDARTAPLGAYGQSKLQGEQALRASGARHFIFRTAWVYAPHGQNFFRTMLRLSGERDELRVVADQHGAPTTTDLIAGGTERALSRWIVSDDSDREGLQGTYHLVASGSTDWHGFASAIVEASYNAGLLQRMPRVTPISTAEFPTPAQRPAWSVLDNRRFQESFAYELPDWRAGLHDVIQALSPHRAV